MQREALGSSWVAPTASRMVSLLPDPCICPEAAASAEPPGCCGLPSTGRGSWGGPLRWEGSWRSPVQSGVVCGSGRGTATAVSAFPYWSPCGTRPRPRGWRGTRCCASCRHSATRLPGLLPVCVHVSLLVSLVAGAGCGGQKDRVLAVGRCHAGTPRPCPSLTDLQLWDARSRRPLGV